ncbi:hypothetical protein CEXT_332511 [Caerostris extrusa]|uniref:Uncharacterized protein n=1 Tax=Caerostris extrusa TaxID=172846 RepID=A0AAV4QYP2_CAEEX|nr:hypothetical protein CEXT_332511 [Caerostris extrusa]
MCSLTRLCAAAFPFPLTKMGESKFPGGGVDPLSRYKFLFWGKYSSECVYVRSVIEGKGNIGNGRGIPCNGPNEEQWEMGVLLIGVKRV